MQKRFYRTTTQKSKNAKATSGGAERFMQQIARQPSDKGRAVFTFTVKELELLHRTKTNVKALLVPKLHRGKYWYEFEIEIEQAGGKKDRGVLCTWRGKGPRLWASVNNALDFLHENLPSLTEIIVQQPPANQRPAAKKKGGGKK